MAAQAGVIVGLLKEIVSLGNTWVKTARERYDLKLDKKRDSALRVADDLKDIGQELVRKVQELDIPEDKEDDINRLLKGFTKHAKSFDKKLD